MHMSSSNPQSLTQAIDWATFMRRHDLVWDRLPHRWENGFFLGNGLIGTLMHLDLQLNRMRWWLCRKDVGQVGETANLADIPHRKLIGSLDIVAHTDFIDPDGEGRLDLWQAEARGDCQTKRGSIGWRCFVPAQPNIVIIELDWTSDHLSRGFHIDPTYQEAGSRSQKGEVQLYEVPDVDADSGGGYTVAWQRFPVADQRELLVFAIGSSPISRQMWRQEDIRTAREEALAELAAFTPRDLPAITAAHRDDWQRMYRRSFVSFGDTELESFYWIQRYKLYAAGRSDAPMIDNHGPWTTETRYGFSTWDMNVQAINRLHLPSNQPELGQPLLQFLQRNFTRKTMLDETSGELRAGMTHRAFLRVDDPHRPAAKHDLGTASCDSACKFLWACHNIWLQYRYTLDETILPWLADWLEGGINTFVAHAQEGEDGYLHVEHGYSWEAYRGPDPTCYIAVVEWALRCRQQIDRLRGESPASRWSDLAAKLPPYPSGPEGYYLAPGQAPVPHRHWSHLMQIWPFHTITWEQPEHRPMIQKSVDHWVDLSCGRRGEPPRAGFAQAAAIQLYARLGQSDPIPGLAEVFLRDWTVRGPCCWASTLYREMGPVIESPLLLADAILACLLQSWEGTIRVFPAWPTAWGDATFHQLRAEGGFLVSAKLAGGSVHWLAVHSEQGQPCEVQVELPDFQIAEGRANQVRQANGVLHLALSAGETILLQAPDSEPPFSVQPVPAQAGRTNCFGLNERFLASRRGHEQQDALYFRGRGLTPWHTSPA